LGQNDYLIKVNYMKKKIAILIAIYSIVIFNSCMNSTGSEAAISEKEAPNIHKHSDTMTANDSAAFVSRSIAVKGDVANKLLLTVDSLRKMKAFTLDEFNVVCMFEGSDSAGTIRKPAKSRTGVLLKDILNKASIKQINHKDRNFIIVARAADNYLATFSWAEIFNNPTGDNVYVLYEENGKPIEKRGEMVLICANDIKTGPRHVIWLKSIEVTRVN